MYDRWQNTQAYIIIGLDEELSIYGIFRLLLIFGTVRYFGCKKGETI